MCGIAGVIGETDANEASAAVQRMIDAEFHRGPDAGGSLVFGAHDLTVALGNRRLAIIELSSRGAQPMTDDATGDALVYNGEIYNFRQLRRELESDGVGFNGHSDTEVLLRACQRWGPAALTRLIGIYAFAWWDARGDRLLLARDRLGIKPLYFARQLRRVVFASEVRALLAGGLVERRLDARGVESYLAYGAVQSPLTLVQGVSSLAPGHYVSIDRDGMGPEIPYWSPPFSRGGGTPTVDPTELRPLLERVVSRQLVSDVPVGLFLSGGIDSSAIAALAAQDRTELRTFSITFKEQEYSEAVFARLVAERFATKHEEVELTESDLLSALPDALAAMDQPTHDGVNVFVVSDVARKAGVTVALSGQGGDEIFGGYSTFRRIPDHLRFALAWSAAGNTLGRLASGALRVHDRLAASQRLRILIGGGDAFAMYRVLRGVFGSPLRKALLGEFDARLVDGIPVEEAERLRREIEGLHPVDAVSRLELALFLGNTLLRDGDFMSMARSIEVRVPLLDDELVDVVTAIPGAAKVDEHVPKHLLVKAMGDLLPREVYERAKQGFTLPWQRWLKTELRPVLDPVLSRRDAGESIALLPGSTEHIWRSFLEDRRVVNWPMVWSLYVLIDWCERNGLHV